MSHLSSPDIHFQYRRRIHFRCHKYPMGISRKHYYSVSHLENKKQRTTFYLLSNMVFGLHMQRKCFYLMTVLLRLYRQYKKINPKWIFALLDSLSTGRLPNTYQMGTAHNAYWQVPHHYRISLRT